MAENEAELYEFFMVIDHRLNEISYKTFNVYHSKAYYNMVYVNSLFYDGEINLSLSLMKVKVCITVIINPLVD